MLTFGPRSLGAFHRVTNWRALMVARGGGGLVICGPGASRGGCGGDWLTEVTGQGCCLVGGRGGVNLFSDRARRASRAESRATGRVRGPKSGRDPRKATQDKATQRKAKPENPSGSGRWGRSAAGSRLRAALLQLDRYAKFYAEP